MKKVLAIIVLATFVMSYSAATEVNTAGYEPGPGPWNVTTSV